MSPQLRRLNAAMVAAAVATFGMLYATQAVLPPIGASYDVGATAASLTVSAATGALALALLPLSSLAESIGRVRVMRVGLLGACVGTFLAAAAPTFWLLLLARGLVGVALAGVVAVAVAHLGDEVPPRQVGTAIGLYVAGNTLGGIVGRLVPGLLEDAGSWRLGVGALGGVAVAATAVFVVLLPAARAPASRPFELGSHLSSLAEVLRDRGVLRLCLVALLLMGGFVAGYNYLTFRLEAAPLGLSTSRTSLLFLAYLAGTLSSPVAGRLADRVGSTRVALGGIVTSLLGLALTLPSSIACITIGLVVFTAGFFATHSVASSWVSRRSAGRRGPAAALYLLGYYLGSSIFGSSIGPAYQAGGWAATACAIAALYLLAAVLVATVTE